MDELINKTIENYTIVSLLGKGGMGVVYKAYDEKLNRYVAIKVLNAPHVKNSRRMIELFKNEARNHAQLIHQNIVTVYGFIEFNNLLGIVMEYVDGESLEKVIFKNRRLHIFDVIYITNQLLDGIGYAHSKGYIHRDIKPSNIIVNSEGVVKIMDFGISKSLEGDSDTRTGARVGTIYYMSPEQIRGQNVNRISDIYSIGCTIYDMLTGNPPFDSKNEYEVMEGHLHENPVSLTYYLPSIPPELDKIVAKLLMKRQEDRYQSCAEVKVAIQQFDQLLKTERANYFNEKQIRRKMSPKKSLISFAFFIIAFIALVVFVVYQVRDFMDYKGYKVFQKHSISALFESKDKIIPEKIKKIPVPTHYSLNSLLIKGNEFTVVGDSGIILNKQSYSSKWQIKQLESKVNLNAFWKFENGEKIFIGKKSAFVYNSGKNYEWYSILDKDYSLNDIVFLNENDGFIIGSGGLILNTINGGKKWERVRSFTDKSLFEINFENNLTGYICGMNGIILKTENGGINWKPLKSGTTKYLKSIDFYDDNFGVCVGGNGIILRTEDSGETWENTQNSTTRPLNKVKFINKSNIIAVGNNGMILISHDSGKTWQSVDSKYYQNWKDIAITDNNELILVGNFGSMLKIELGDK
jgi:serine/threonine-protein kinase